MGQDAGGLRLHPVQDTGRCDAASQASRPVRRYGGRRKDSAGTVEQRDDHSIRQREGMEQRVQPGRLHRQRQHVRGLARPHHRNVHGDLQAQGARSGKQPGDGGLPGPGCCLREVGNDRLVLVRQQPGQVGIDAAVDQGRAARVQQHDPGARRLGAGIAHQLRPERRQVAGLQAWRQGQHFQGCDGGGQLTLDAQGQGAGEVQRRGAGLGTAQPVLHHGRAEEQQHERHRGHQHEKVQAPPQRRSGACGGRRRRPVCVHGMTVRHVSSFQGPAARASRLPRCNFYYCG